MRAIAEAIKHDKRPEVRQRAMGLRLLHEGKAPKATLVKSCPTNRNKAVLLTFIDTGARLSEVISINWEDIDVASGLINIARGKGGKSSNRRCGHRSALRRTFATLSLRTGLNPLHVQGVLGHSTLYMARSYVQMVDEDLVVLREHSPIDNILHKR